MTRGGKRGGANPRYAHRTRREALRARLKAEGKKTLERGLDLIESLDSGDGDDDK